jgi:hypothetical protein
MTAPLRRKLVRAALCAIDLRRRPPDEARSPGLLQALRALRRPPAPRTVRFITVKRINPRVHRGDCSERGARSMARRRMLLIASSADPFW